MTATFGLQGAHEEGADEFDALLEDVHTVGLSGVLRVIGASHREDLQDREMSVTTHAGSSRWDSGRTSRRKCRKSDSTDTCWDDNGKGRRSREAWPSIESGSVKENDGGGWQHFFSFLEKLGERSSLARRAVRAARAASMPCGLPRVPEQGSIEPVSVEIWRRYQRRR